jgi:phosphatidylglycerol:prolipoprotein diacylglycerol transferase
MFPVVQIGPFAMQTPGLALLIGLWLGLSLAERMAYHFKVNPNSIYNLTFIALTTGLIGARLSYVAQYANAFIANPLSLISLNPGLLDPIGGTIIGIIAAVIYANRNQLPLWSTLDSLTPLLAVMAVAFGISHLASGDNFGMPTNLSWGINLWGANRHPTQIYETVLAGLILWGVWARAKRGNLNTSKLPGVIFWIFLSLSASARLIVEGFRGDSIVLANGFRTAQIASWVVLALSLWMLERQLRQHKGYSASHNKVDN